MTKKGNHRSPRQTYQRKLSKFWGWTKISSILGLNWNTGRDSLFVCRGTEHKIPAKINQKFILFLVSAEHKFPAKINQRFILFLVSALGSVLPTRALHFEVAQSLDTDSSLAAVTGFTARRGYPDTINSDNRTNFVRTTSKLKAAMNNWEKAKIESDLAQKKIVWKFNPPGAPHFHRMIEKNWFKFAGKSGLQSRTSKVSSLVYSAQQFVLEQILKARPLTAVIDKSENLNLNTSLTPNHPLLGRENARALIMPTSERYNDLQKSFNIAQAYADTIGKRWTRNHLTHWKQRSKWLKEHVRNLKQGDHIWLIDDSVNRLYVSTDWDDSLKSSLAKTVLCDQRESKLQMISREDGASILRWCFR